MPLPTRLSRGSRRGAVTILTAVGGLVLLASPALAHVSVSPETAPAGSSIELSFRVPNEESNASTSEVTVQIPTDHPIAQVLVKPVPGWTSTTQTTTLTTPLVTDDGSFTSVVSQITWRGGRIAPGGYQDFDVSVDPLPDQPGQLVFKALQTYTNGDVVRWIDVQQPGQDEPEHPAPTLTLTASPSTPSMAGSMAPGMTPSMRGAPTAHAASSSSSWPGVVAVVGLAVGLVALLLAGWGLRRRPPA